MKITCPNCRVKIDIGNPIASMGGKACLKKRGRKFYKLIAKKRWKKNGKDK